jgi:hypothetical protein
MSDVVELGGQGDEDERRGEAAILDALRGREYRAFQSLPGRTTKPRMRLFLLPRRGVWEWLGNSGLWRMRAKPDGTWIGLTYHSAAIIVEGSGLLDAAFAIDRHTCLFLQEHNPERHDASEQGAAVITSMRFFYPAGEPGEDKAAARH